MSSTPSNKSTQNIEKAGGDDHAALGEPVNWLAQPFAQFWYDETCAQACDPSECARRREIIFAVACAESYLVEWLRKLLGPKCANVTLEVNGKQGILEQWKTIPKALQRAGEIPAVPTLGGSSWANFHKVVQFRNGLLHGRASRAYVPGQPSPQTMPKVEELQQLQAGYARDAVRNLMIELNTAAQTARPDWLVDKPAK